MKDSYKKLFLVTSLLMAGLSMMADYSDYYKVYYNGEELENGATIISDYSYKATIGNREAFICEANVYVVNCLPYSNLNRAVIEYTDQPSYDEWKADWTKWGNIKLCYAGGDANGEMASCMGTSGTVRIPDSSMDCFNWQIHLEYVPEGVESEYVLNIVAGEGELQWNNYTLIEGSEFTLNIVFPKQEDAGVEIIPEEEGDPEFYTVDGVRVENPVKGLYIMKRGKTSKKILL